MFTQNKIIHIPSGCLTKLKNFLFFSGHLGFYFFCYKSIKFSQVFLVNKKLNNKIICFDKIQKVDIFIIYLKSRK